MKKKVKVAALQYQTPKDYHEGERKVGKFVSKASKKNVDIVGLPEECLGQVNNNDKPLEFLSSIAKKYGVYLFGATYLYSGKRIRNVGFLFDGKGKLIIVQDKIVLTPPAIKEGFKAGMTIKVVDTEFGRLALLVCKDSFHRYAAWFFDKLMKFGVDIVLIPSSSITVSERSINLWTDTVKTMSMLFNVFIIAPGTVGKDNNSHTRSFGHALIVDPQMVVLAEGSKDKEEVLYATLNKANLDRLRSPEASKWQPESVPKFKVERL